MKNILVLIIITLIITSCSEKEYVIRDGYYGTGNCTVIINNSGKEIFNKKAIIQLQIENSGYNKIIIPLSIEGGNIDAKSFITLNPKETPFLNINMSFKDIQKDIIKSGISISDINDFEAGIKHNKLNNITGNHYDKLTGISFSEIITNGNRVSGILNIDCEATKIRDIEAYLKGNKMSIKCDFVLKKVNNYKVPKRDYINKN